MPLSRPLAVIAAAFALSAAGPAAADQKLLDTVAHQFGQFFFLQVGTPAMVLGIVKDGETAVAGFGEFRDGNGTPPDGDTLLRIGSNTKTFTGGALAAFVADGTLRFTDPLQDHLGYDVTLPERDDQPIRLYHLATHTSGLPREASATDEDKSPEENRAVLIADLASDPLLFAPGASAYYSNFGFNLLATALSNVAGKPYEEVLAERIFGPAGMTSTTFAPTDADRARLMEGHLPDGSPYPDGPTPEGIQGAGGLYSTANDMLRYLAFQLDRSSGQHAEWRLLAQASYVPRDTLQSALGLDESGAMDAMGLGWVVMNRDTDRGTILQKSGGHGGIFSFTAFMPGEGVGVFIAINAFDFSGAVAIAEFATDLLTQLAAR